MPRDGERPATGRGRRVMREGAAYLRVGLLIVVGAALTIGLLWFLGGRTIAHSQVIETYFRESVQGLDVGSPVKYRGVTLGRVTDIGLVNAEYSAEQEAERDPRTFQMVFVRYEIDLARTGPLSGVQSATRSGLRARLAAQGITGLSYIELDFVDPQRYPALVVPWSPKFDVIPSMPSSFSQVQDAAQRALAKLNAVDVEGLSTSLLRLLETLQQEVATGAVHGVLTQASDLLGSLQGTVKTADLPALTADLRQTSAALRELAQGEETKRMLSGAANAADGLARVSAQLPAVLATLQATTRRLDGGTADLQRSLLPVMRDLQATADNLREVTESLRRSPSQLLFGQPPPRPRGDGPAR